MPDPLPVPPGGERQDPRVEAAAKALYEQRGWRQPWADVDGGLRRACLQAADAVLAAADAASSVPVGGAPRDDQNDDGPHIWLRWEDDEAGGMYVCGDEGGEFARATHPAAILLYIADLLDGGTMREAGLKRATQETRERSASASPNPDSGAAPKGELEEALCSMCGRPKRVTQYTTVTCGGHGSPPPDRLTDLEEMEALTNAVHWGVSQFPDEKQVRKVFNELRGRGLGLARLADRESEA